MKNETTAVEVVCPHCKTRWTWSEDNWFAVIKRHGSGCRCPDNWICTLCSKRCVEPTDVTQYLKNGAHVDCADKELHGELRFPKCECGCTRGRHAGPNAEEYCLRSKCSCDEYRPVTTASPATAELLPCPFCGEQPDRIDEHRVQCCNDQCGNYIKMMNIQDWNTRTGSTSQIAALRSALESIERECADVRKGIRKDCPSIEVIENSFFVIQDAAANALKGGDGENGVNTN